MNTKTLLTVKMDKSLKQAAQETALEIGLPLGTLINSLVKQFVRTKEVTLSAELVPTPALLAALAEGERDFAAGKLGKAQTFEELVKDLRS